MDSRARECENPAYFVILAHNCDLGAPTIPQSTKKLRIFVSYVRIVVLFSTIFGSLFPFFSANFRRSRGPRFDRDFNSIG